MLARLARTFLLALVAIITGADTFVRAADEPKQEQPGEPKVVKLPAAALRSVVAADGRFVVVHMPKAKQIAVFDVKEGKIAKSLPAPEDDIVLAGALDYLFVVRKSNNTMQRWSLATFEKEATVRLPVGAEYEEVCMGCASNGPMLLCSKSEWPNGAKLALLNPVTVREVPRSDYLPPPDSSTIRVSPDGKVFSWTTTGIRQIAVLRAVDGKFAAKLYPVETYNLQPGPGGRFFYTTSHVYDDEVRQIHPRPGVAARNWIRPAVQGPIFLELEWISGAAATGPQGYRRAYVFFEGKFKPIGTIYGLDKPETSNAFPYLIPRYGQLICFGKNSDELILHRFDLDALLAKSDIDLLVVMSDPPQVAVAGKTFAYAPVVKSKKGGVKVKLEAGPDGMKLGADSKLTWDVPAAQAKQEVVVILSISDSSGQDMFHTFRLQVVAPPAEKP